MSVVCPAECNYPAVVSVRFCGSTEEARKMLQWEDGNGRKRYFQSRLNVTAATPSPSIRSQQCTVCQRVCTFVTVSLQILLICLWFPAFEGHADVKDAKGKHQSRGNIPVVSRQYIFTIFYSKINYSHTLTYPTIATKSSLILNFV